MANIPVFDPEELLKRPPVEFLPFLHQLLVKDSDTLLPEIVSLIGREKLREFLLTFEGETITIPSWESVLLSVKDAYLLWRISEIVPYNAHATRKELEGLYGVSWNAVQQRAEAIKASLNE